MLDLERLRLDTPGCLERVFLDSAGSSLPPQPVLATVIEHLRREAEVGGYVRTTSPPCGIRSHA